jgi:hypothetical protein
MNRWNLISSKKTEDRQNDTNLSKKPNEMVQIKDETEASVVDTLFERKKRRYGELDATHTGSKSGMTTLQNLHINKPPALQTNIEAISKMKQETIKQRDLKQQLETGTGTIHQSSNVEALKTLSIELLEKFLYLDEKFIDTDKNIGYGGYNTSNFYILYIIHNSIGFIKKQNTNYIIRQKEKYPDVLFNIFKSEGDEKFSFSGLYVPLNILYFVRNNVIYLWDYVLNQIYTYNDISNIIVNLHITLPKIGVFSNEVAIKI